MHMKCNISKTANLCIWVIINSTELPAYMQSLFRNKIYMLDVMFQQNASNFGIFLEYEKT